MKSLPLIMTHKSFPVQIIQIAPMPVVQTNVHPSAAVHPGNSFPVSMGTATVMAPGSAPSQTVLLTPPPTRLYVYLCMSVLDMVLELFLRPGEPTPNCVFVLCPL